MPRETTRHLPHLQLLEGGLDFEIREHGGDVRVVLSGNLDRDLLERIVPATTPRLARRGCRVVLDGARLAHLDYRAVPALVEWGRDLRAYGHRLLIAGWRPYLRVILALGGSAGAPAASTTGPLSARHGTSAP
jgi:ABC-type transporter Mla MlaB component